QCSECVKRREAQQLRDPHERCGQQPVEPEVQEITTSIASGYRRPLDAPLRKPRIGGRHLPLDDGNSLPPERWSVERREVQCLRPGLTAVSDDTRRRTGDQYQRE